MFSHHQDIQEETKLEAMQKIWQNRRNQSVGLNAFFKSDEEWCALSRQNSRSNNCVPFSQPTPCSDVESDNDSVFDFQESTIITQDNFKNKSTDNNQKPFKLDASTLGDLPAHYVVYGLQPYQMPVCGVFIDKRIIPGFKYRVRPLPSAGQKCINFTLFNNKALTLKSIGRGFARRFTFESNKNQLNSNDNYFYSDNRPEGYGFELELISDGDKFTIFDMNCEPQGTVEILKVEGFQLEIFSSVNKKSIEKRANCKFTGKVEFYDTGVAKAALIRGVVVAVKSNDKNQAEVIKITNVHLRKRRWYLIPGIQNNYRRVTVRGEDINDVPTKYTMTGLKTYEIPVVGTYVDPRIITGFSYRVRPNNRKNHLFNGRALRLLSIGMGYAKRLTFEPDSLVNPDNYLWSDNHPDGLGLEPRAVCKGMKFMVQAGNQIIGEASIFRDDLPQVEEKTEKIMIAPGAYAFEKYIFIDVICHIQLTHPGGASSEQDSYLMRVSGQAIVRKEPKSNTAKVIEIYNIGLDSQLNILFSQTHTEIKFMPK